MRSLLAVALALVTVQQGIPPVVVQEPVTRPVLTCPDGYTLWVRVQQGFVGNGDGTVTMRYRWYTYNRRDATWGDETPTCFKSDPNVKSDALPEAKIEEK